MASKIVTKHETRSNVFDKVFAMDTADCCFQFVDTTTNTVSELKAHKQVLAAVSTVFAAMFNGLWIENIGPITIEDASIETFENFLGYFYKDQVTLTVNNVAATLNLAQKYDLPDLVKCCESFMSTSLSVSNVLGYHSEAVRFNNDSLQAKCKKLFSQTSGRILRLKSFRECDSKTLAAFLSELPQNGNAAKVFDACIAWAKHKCQQNGRDETDLMNLRTELGDCFRLICFEQAPVGAMASRFITYKSMFTKDESDEMFKNLFESLNGRHYLKPLGGMKLEYSGCYEDDEAQVQQSIYLKVSKSVTLHSITAAELWRSDIQIAFSAKIVVCTDNKTLFARKAVFKVDEMKFVFPEKVEIEAGVAHQINLFSSVTGTCLTGGYLYKRQRLAGVEIVPVDEDYEDEASADAQYCIEAMEFIVPDE